MGALCRLRVGGRTLRAAARLRLAPGVCCIFYFSRAMRKMQCTVMPKSASNIVQETVKNVHESCEWCTPKRKNSPLCRKNRRAGLCRARPGAYNKNSDGNEDGRVACCLSGRIGAACGAAQPPADKTQGPACRRKQRGKKSAADTARPPPGRGAPTGARGHPKQERRTP